MKKLLLSLSVFLLVLCAARAEGLNPLDEMKLDAQPETASAERPLALQGLDFGEGASILRFKAVTEGELTIRVYVDKMEGSPAATALFRPLMKENRRNVELTGTHDLYLVLEGSGTLTSLQAFRSVQDIEAAVPGRAGRARRERHPRPLPAKLRARRHGGKTRLPGPRLYGGRGPL